MNLVAIAGVDTRRLTRAIRDGGAPHGAIVHQPDDPICDFGSAPELPGTAPEHAPAWAALAELLLTRQGAYRRRMNKNQGFPRVDDGQKNRLSSLISP